MKVFVGVRVMLALLVAVLLPLAQAHCALTMPHASESVAVEAEQHGGEDDCCPEPASHPASPTDPCCCDNFQLPSATSPPLISVDSPTSVAAPIAVVAALAIAAVDRDAYVRFEPDVQSGSPPDPSADPQSPRSPPRSA